MDLINIYRAIYPNTKRYTFFFSAPHGIFSKINHTLGHKTSLHRYQKTEIRICILSEQYGLKLNIENARIYRECTNSWNYSLMNRNLVKTTITEEIRNILQLNENENTTNTSLWDTMKAVLRGKLIELCIYIKVKKSYVGNLGMHLKGIE